MVEHVLDHVRRFVLKTNAGRDLKMDRVVATIPVNMDGHRRALLRQAFRQAGMSVVQFVHEPLAALYGYLRMSEGTPDLIRRYDGKLLLVSSRWIKKMSVIDTTTGQLVRQVKVGKSPHGIWTLDHAKRY
jgi:YVTN family beta-propeller protein